MENPTELFGGRCKIYQGHVLETLRQIPDNSVHCCVTSSPYLNLRNYNTNPQIWDADENCLHDWRKFTKKGTTGGTASAKVKIKGEDNFQIVADSEQAECVLCGAIRCELGAEPTPALYISHLVQIFREVRRVLHPTGVLWVNIGDSYAANRSYQVGSTKGGAKHSPAQSEQTGNKVPDGMKPKDKIGVPQMLALAMRADGWYWRAEMPWVKLNGMPSSTEDRPTVAHEQVLMFSKSAKYFYDHVAVMRPAATKSMSQTTFKRKNGKSTELNAPNHPLASHREMRADTPPTGNRFYRTTDLFLDSLGVLIDEQSEYLSHLHDIRRDGGMLLDDAGDPLALIVNTRGYKGAHFAVFNAKLVEPLVLSGTGERGVCPECGSQWKRLTKRTAMVTEASERRELYGNATYTSGKMISAPTCETVGWEPSCDCNAGDPVPATVLDPFHGSGTTSVVALNHGRNAIGCELNPEYVQLSIARIEKEVTGQLGLGV